MDNNLKLIVIHFIAAASFFSCDHYPQDPNNTLKKIRGGEMYVGLIENPPFVQYSGGDTSGIEVDLLQDFANVLEAEILWVTANEAVLMDKLQHHELHLVLGGLEKTTPYTRRIGITRPYFRDFVMAIPQGENAFLIELEKFLKARQLQINKDLVRYDG